MSSSNVVLESAAVWDRLADGRGEVLRAWRFFINFVGSVGGGGDVDFFFFFNRPRLPPLVARRRPRRLDRRRRGQGQASVEAYRAPEREEQ